MMIAYSVTIPNPHELSELLESAVAVHSAAYPVEFAAILDGGRTITAYDGERLIGYGKADADTEGIQTNVWVHQEYREREIDRVIGKLLLARNPGYDQRRAATG